MIVVAPVLEDGSPFPTTYWLTCPRLVEAVHELESAGEGARFAARVAGSPALAEAVRAADAAYRVGRTAEGGGADPCAGVGVAGQSDPLAMKCLHARLAAHLSGIADPIGDAVASVLSETTVGPCADVRCGARVAPSC